MKRQKGLYLVEFAIVGALFLILLFGLIEFGRALFVWNTLTEATRRGARLAVVCPENHASIQNVAVFNDPDASSDTGPILPGLETDMVIPEYARDGAGNVTNVTVRISGYQHALLIPFFDTLLDAPEFATTLPRESLGCVPDMANGGNCVYRCP